MSDELKEVIGFIIGTVIGIVFLWSVLYLAIDNHNSFKENCIESGGTYIEGIGIFSQDQCIYKVDKE